jgi:hypothetical protein
MKANREATETNAEEMKPVTVHEDVPDEEAAEKSSGALKKRHKRRHVGVGRRGKPKERTQGKCGSRRTLAAARRGMTPPWRRDTAGTTLQEESEKVERTRKNLRKSPKCKIGLKNPGTRRQLRLQIGRTSDGLGRKAF